MFKSDAPRAHSLIESETGVSLFFKIRSEEGAIINFYGSEVMSGTLEISRKIHPKNTNYLDIFTFLSTFLHTFFLI